MTNEELIQLTNELYRITILFPKKEPLRYKIREIADDIIEDLLTLGAASYKNDKRQSVLTNLEALKSFIEIARNQKWVEEEAILNLTSKYDSIKTELEAELKEEVISFSEKERVKEADEGISERQKRILEFLKGKERVQVWEFKEIFPSVTKRTLRRDFAELLRKGLIERRGEKNETFYRLKPEQELAITIC